MHIPDGYLSPATCLATYALAVPFWSVALKRVERRLDTRMVPLLALFSAFSFVIMMFNLPLPGGTTGHAVGMGIAAVVLGPWAGMLAISIALLIQSVFFGDGGITTLGANCLNMAIVGSIVAWIVYRLVAGRAALTSPRRVVAAALAGYIAINVSALLAAIEFGVQPLWFHAADGTPLYAPYPLAIAIPAMMIGHLGPAGLAEAIVSAGLVAWLQRGDPALLRATAPDAPLDQVHEPADTIGGWSPARKLLAGLAVLMLLSPLGLLASGGAWGEWDVEAFARAETRQQIAVASGLNAPPQQAPAGLARLASAWSAPLPDYAVPSLSAPVGYVLSAVAGSGLVILIWLLVGRFMTRRSGADA